MLYPLFSDCYPLHRLLRLHLKKTLPLMEYPVEKRNNYKVSLQDSVQCCLHLKKRLHYHLHKMLQGVPE